MEKQLSLPHQRFGRWIEWRLKQAEAASQYGILKGRVIAAIARELDCSKQFLMSLRTGAKNPGALLMAQIEKVTKSWPDGPIATSEWLDAGFGTRKTGKRSAA